MNKKNNDWKLAIILIAIIAAVCAATILLMNYQIN